MAIFKAKFLQENIIVKAWQNWPTLIAKDCCQFPLKSGITFLSIANDSETNKSVCQAVLASFDRPLVERQEIAHSS